MPQPTVTIRTPPPTTFPDPGILRPEAEVAWTSGTGPFDVLHEWDTAATFDTGNLIQDSNTGATSPDVGVPPSDMGPAGTTWYYRATVTDTSDSAATTTNEIALSWEAAQLQRRYLYALANVGVGFDPIDTPAAGWDPESHGGADAGDGYAQDFRRYLYALANVGVAFNPTDTTTPGPDDDNWPADGFTKDFRRYLYALANVGVGFDPIDTPAAGWDPESHGGADAGDGYAQDFRRYLYALANLTDDTPTPHIWYLFPTFGREGWEFQIIGYGFGDTQATFSGSVTLNGLAVGITSWELVAETSPDLTINPTTNVAEPVHQLIRAVVPEDAESGLVIVCTDGP